MMIHHEEIQEKKHRVRQLMEQLQLDGILLRKQCNFSWLTAGRLNLVGIATEMGVASLLITPEKEYVICNNIEAPRIEQEEQLADQGYDIRSFKWYDDQEQQIVQELTKNGKVGCDSPFPGTDDISKSLNPLRYALTPWEVERYKEVGYLTSKAIEETAKTIEPGDKECEIIGRLAEHLWADRVDYITTFCAADERIAKFRHPIATEKKIENRAMLCVNGRKWGLIISLTRFVHFGKVPADLQKKYEDNVYIDNLLMANTIPGKPAIEAFNKAIDAYKELGYAGEYELHHQGGSIGYVGRDYKVNFTTTEIIQENQAFSWNPSITGSKSEDVMLATSQGPVLLSKPVIYPTMTSEVGGYTFVRPAILEK
ncbi:M24 family metallopeptidase [candidate division KSB3 bacterium]|uniref:M24 family metallopeptidase n=1 Tax=candidate division KSB3 bacterium TaxID=2044937 RepID=A0A9D5Q7V4_9BACT|nr:M24 family metallopeptidase [candidate division KSB3 bacterium]MBD3326281.1 M24 family metallopeptidase [candidate division KSB3 bacterium]